MIGIDFLAIERWKIDAGFRHRAIEAHLRDVAAKIEARCVCPRMRVVVCACQSSSRLDLRWKHEHRKSPLYANRGDYAEECLTSPMGRLFAIAEMPVTAEAFLDQLA